MDLTMGWHIPTRIPMTEIQEPSADSRPAGQACEGDTFYKLLAWLSPSFPVGAFAYSHGLEWAVEAGDVGGARDLEVWVGDLLAVGSGRTDGILFAHAHAAALSESWEDLEELSALARALAPSKERRLETLAQGTAFLDAIAKAWPWPGLAAVRDALGVANPGVANPGVGDPASGSLRDEVPYPIAVAAVCAGHGVPVRPALHAYLHAFAANLVSAGVRLIPLGQSDGQRVTAGLSAAVEACLDQALSAPLEALGGIALAADIASMRHETQYTRLFRS